jgi:hypothetical protein
MTTTDLRDNLAVAVDGGGIRGLMVARALMALEARLDCKPLIDCPRVKVLSGTSTGAILTAGIAIGMQAEALTDFYTQASQAVFQPVLSANLPEAIQSPLKVVARLLRPALYAPDKIREIMRSAIAAQTGSPDLTLGELHERLQPQRQALVITTVDVNERRTRFLKSYDSRDSHWKLWEAVMASAAAPSYLPVRVHPDSTGRMRYYTDGSAGSYGNPAYIAAREIVQWQGYAPQQCSVVSFGTGWVDADTFEQSRGKATGWKALSWLLNGYSLLMGDAARAQSLDILHDFVAGGLDFQRYQLLLTGDIALDDASDEAIAKLRQLGAVLADRVRNGQHALSDSQYDPEGIGKALARVAQSLESARVR